MKKFIIPLVTVGVVVGVMLVGCFGAPAPEVAPPVKEEVVKMALIQPMSGAAAPWGIGCGRGVILGLLMINDQGGFKVGDTTYTWDYKVYDGKYIPSETLSCANKAVYDYKADFITVLGGAPSIAVIPLMKENNMLFVMHGSGGLGVTNPDNPHVFRSGAEAYIDFPGIYSYFKENEGVETIASLNPDDETGHAGFDGEKRAADALGLEFTNEFFERGMKDFAPILTKVMATNPDMICTGLSSPSSAALLVKQSGELGYEGIVSCSWGPNPEEVLEVGGEYAEGDYIVMSAPVIVDDYTPEQMNAYNRYCEEWSADEWDPITLTYWQLGVGITQAIEETQSFDTDVLAKHLRGMRYETPLGEAYYGGSKIFGYKSSLVMPRFFYKIRGGEYIFMGSYQSPSEVLD